MKQRTLYIEFLRICRYINEKFNINPVLYGSLGLGILTNTDFNSLDIDMLIPHIYIKSKWDIFEFCINKLGYKLADLHEHEFHKDEFKIAFSFEEDLESFADIDYRTLEIINDGDCFYKQLSLEDYLKAYTKSLEDGYRKTKNNGKDVDKIELIKNLLKTFKV